MKTLLFIIFFIPTLYVAQTNNLQILGTVSSNGNPVAFASVYIKGGTQGTSADKNGKYKLVIPATNTITITATSQGYRSLSKTITLSEHTTIVDFSLTEDALGIDQVIVSATRNRISKKEAPVIVKVLSPKLFQATQSLSLADGLNFQPGVA